MKLHAGRPVLYRIIFVLLVSLVNLEHYPIHGQETTAEKILRNADAPFLNLSTGGCSPDDLNAGGCCGAPGRRLCSTLPSCTNPSGNHRQSDPFDASVVCELPKPSCSQLFAANQMLAQNPNGPLDVTFYLTSDIHYWRNSFRLPDTVRHVRLMNEFPGLGQFWPPGIGFPNTTFPQPQGVVIAGDLTVFGQKEELGAYRLLYEQGQTADSIQYSVFPGLGNHDIDLSETDHIQRMFDYVGDTMGCAVNMDSASHSYSWNWNKLHIIQLNEWAGFQSGPLIPPNLFPGVCPGPKCPYAVNSGLPWLARDLANKVGNSGGPVLIVQHLGCDSFSAGSPSGLRSCTDADTNSVDNKGKPIIPWWTAANRQAFMDVIKPYNIIGLFTGHTHYPEVDRVYDLKDASGNEVIRLDNYVNGAGGTNDNDDFGGDNGFNKAKWGHGEFYVVRVTDSYLDVVPIQWTDTRTNLTDDQRRDQSTETSRIAPTAISTQGTNLGDVFPPPGFKFNQPGCRKRIGDRFITVPVNMYQLSSAGADLVSVKNVGGVPIPGPLAIRVPQQTPAVSFVDSCVDEGTANKSYVLVGIPLGQSLAPGSSAIVNAGVPFDPGRTELVVLTPIAGTSQNSVSITVAPKASVPSGSVTFYGPPFAAISARVTGDEGLGWLKLTWNGSFDAFGYVVVNYSVDTTKLPVPSTGSLTVTIEVSTLQPDAQGLPFVRGVPFTLTFKAAVAVQLTATPAVFASPATRMSVSRPSSLMTRLRLRICNCRRERWTFSKFR